MKNRYFTVVLLLMLLLCSSMSAQSLREMFVNMPTELLPLLKQNDRLDLIDLYDAKMSAPVTNRLDGKSRLKELTGDYLLLSLSASSSMQIKMLPTQNGDTLLCVVNTVLAEAADSRINFYGKDWQPVDGKLFDSPAIADFLLPSDSVNEVLEFADIYLVELRLSSDDNTLVAEYTQPRYMSKEEKERIMPLLRKISYEWNGISFQRND